MKTLIVNVNEDSVSLQTVPSIASGNVESIKCEIHLSEAFNGLTVRACFNGAYRTVIDGECMLPMLSPGECEIGVYGCRVTQNEEEETIYERVISPSPAYFYVSKGSFNEKDVESADIKASEADRLNDIKLDKQQGKSNAGKVMTVGADGIVTPQPGGGSAPYTAGDGIEIDDDEISLKKEDTFFAFNANRLTAKIGEIDRVQGDWRVVNGLLDASMFSSWLNKFVSGDFAYDNGVFTLKPTAEALHNKQDIISVDNSLIKSNNQLSVNFAKIDPETGEWEDDEALKAKDWLDNQGELIKGTQAGRVIYGALGGNYPLNTQKALNFFTSVILPLINDKANASTTYTKTEVDTAVNNKISAPANASEGDFLRYRNGTWGAETVASAESEAF